MRRSQTPEAAGKQCPQCGLWCTDLESRCDCGYDFLGPRRHDRDHSGALSLGMKWALLGGALLAAVGWSVASLGTPMAWGMILLFPVGLLDAVGLLGRDESGYVGRLFVSPVGWVLYVYLGWAFLASRTRRGMVAPFAALCAMLALNVAGLHGWRLW